jgi:hypothetical protein
MGSPDGELELLGIAALRNLDGRPACPHQFLSVQVFHTPLSLYAIPVAQRLSAPCLFSYYYYYYY